VPDSFEEYQNLEIHVSGTVQGVGFRPFIYNLARSLRLVGTVWNHSKGVTIHAQGAGETLHSFIESISASAPPAARVQDIRIVPRPVADFTEFRILPSVTLEGTFTQISPDLALCVECRRELEEDGERRRDYPFINCTHCGPRFTIIRALPYDRPQTTMKDFPLCEKCRAEYNDPTDRRFHAQPVACRHCGPHLQFVRNDQREWSPTGNENDAISLAVQALRDGKIILIQGIGGFHLACDAGSAPVIAELRLRKHRDEKPFAVMFPSEEILQKNCVASGIELAFLRSYRAPILLLNKKVESEIAEAVAPGHPCLGAMLPYSPLHVLLLREFKGPLIMTSANFSDEPIAFKVSDALERMSNIADGALIHDREIHIFADDSVVKVIGGIPRVWRRSRGYVPEAVHVPVPFRVPTLAFGPQLKNTFCLGKQSFALLSQHLGDLENDLAAEAESRALEHFLRIYDAEIGLAACDLHPDYTTTRLAEAWCARNKIPLIRVQHHHAHLAACLAENGRSDKAIGLCLDGTGYGTDGTIWGGEVLVGDFSGFERAGHLQTVAMPGGERAAKEPWRMALSWLREVYGEQLLDQPIPLIEQLKAQWGEDSLRVLLNPSLNENAFPRTSSLGRLFDAAAALIFFGTRKQFEGQAAMLLEGLISHEAAEPYPVEIQNSPDGLILSPVSLFDALVTDIKSGMNPAIMSRRFHEGVVDGFIRICSRVSDESGLKTVALNGGCFQNSFLLTSFEQRLSARGFTVLSHEQVPPNDGGVSLGQAVIANAQHLDS
jgi:hydrogenase maturation protein HypF